MQSPIAKTSKTSEEIARLIVNVCQIDLVIMGVWLKEQRKSIPEDKEWHAFVNKFVDDIDTSISQSNSKKEILLAARDVIRDVAFNLEPHHDCCVELLNRVQALNSIRVNNLNAKL
jgi:hypothetical protein